MTAPQSPQPTVDASDAVGERDELARAIDPDVFDETVKKSARDIAVLQWAIRRKRAFDAADAVLASPALACRDDRMRREGAAGVVAAWTPELTHFDIHRDEFMATYPAFVAGCGVTEVAA